MLFEPVADGLAAMLAHYQRGGVSRTVALGELEIHLRDFLDGFRDA
ncbi:hypothetical protein [Marmoricola sp. RAF53]